MFNDSVGVGEAVQIGVTPLPVDDTPPVEIRRKMPLPPDAVDEKVGPVRAYRTIIQDSGSNGYVNRMLVGTPTTGLVRIEWHQARIGQITPPNWSNVQMMQYMNSYVPLRYQVADAQNLISKVAIEGDFEWLLLYEHDVLPPPDAFLRLNEYVIAEEVPIVSGLYYTRTHPTEPLVYRGRGTGSYRNFKIGDQVWCDGVPTGFLLIHTGILREMWKDSEEYMVGAIKTRRVFNTPRALWFDPSTDSYNTLVGTSDLDWCTRVMEGNYLAKAGWKAFAGKPYPFLCDTALFCQHINPNGESFPT